MSARTAAIVGIHEHPRRVIAEHSVLQVKAMCARAALDDAGLSWADVDGLYDTGEAGWINGCNALSEYFGIHPRAVDSTAVGGSSFEVLASRAVADITLGHVRVALITYCSRQRSQGRSASLPRANTPNNNMEDVWGNTTVGHYALAARRHIHQYGTTSEQLAEIPVACRRHALRNADAVDGLADLGIRPSPLTVDDVVSSRLIADPLHLLDCCLVSDGGGAVVIAASDVVTSARQPPVWIIGSGTAIGYVENGGDITTSAARDSGRTAFGAAGVTANEIDVAMLYDSFSFTVLTALEDLGFCGKGEGGAFVSGGRLAYDDPSRPAVNTDGGGLSSNHPGMRGLFLLIEATRQLRGTSTSQVPGARLAVAHGNGGYLAGRHCASTLVLAS